MDIKNFHSYQISYLDKKIKEIKIHIILNFLVHCTGYRLVTIKKDNNYIFF
jgi:hypothetical protein